MNITKRSGAVVLYDTTKTVSSILKANAEVMEEKITPHAAELMAEEAFEQTIASNEIITTQDLRESVIAVLRKSDYLKTAKRYAEYKK